MQPLCYCLSVQDQILELSLKDLKIGVGVHQGSAISPLLFTAVVKEATCECGREVLWKLQYASYLMLTAKTKEEVRDMQQLKNEMDQRTRNYPGQGDGNRQVSRKDSVGKMAM